MFGQWNAIQESLYKISRPKIHTAQVIDHDVKILYSGKINKIVKPKHNDYYKANKWEIFAKFSSAVTKAAVTCFIRIVARITAISFFSVNLHFKLTFSIEAGFVVSSNV